MVIYLFMFCLGWVLGGCRLMDLVGVSIGVWKSQDGVWILAGIGFGLVLGLR